MEREQNPALAREVFEEGVISYGQGLAKHSCRFVIKGNLQRWCDSAYLAYILDEESGRVVGMVLSFQKNNLVYSILSRGIIFEDEESVEETLYSFRDGAEKWSRRGCS